MRANPTIVGVGDRARYCRAMSQENIEIVQRPYGDRSKALEAAGSAR